MITVDRIEGKYAVCKIDKASIDIPLSLIDGKIQEGSILIKKGERYIIDTTATANRKEALFNKQNSLFE